MATDFFSDEDEKDKQNNQITQPQSQLSGDTGIITGNSPGQAPTNPGEKSSSGSFTNLNAYLDANKDQNFGQQVAGKVDQQIVGAQNAQSQADTQFRSAADQSAVKKNQGLIDSAISNPQNVVGNQDQFNEFTKMRDANYTGPQSFAAAQDIYSPAQSSTEKAYETSNATKNESGRKAYLNQEYGSQAGRMNYTPGQQKLDNFLIQADPNSYKAFQNEWAKGQDTKNNFGTLSSALDQYAQGSAANTADARKSTRGALGLNDDNSLSASSPILQTQAAAKTRADQLNQQKQTERNDFATGAASRKFNDQQLAELGLSRGQHLFGVNPNEDRFISTAADIDYNHAATPEEVAKESALSKLAGVDNTFLPYADQAGQYNKNDFNKVNIDALMQEIKGRQAAYDTDLGINAFNQGGKIFSGTDGPNIGQNTLTPGSDVSYAGGINGLTAEQIQQIYGVNAGQIDAGMVSGNINDNINFANRQLGAEGNDPRYWSNQHGRYEAQKNQFEQLLNAIQQKHKYSDVLL